MQEASLGKITRKFFFKVLVWFLVIEILVGIAVIASFGSKVDGETTDDMVEVRKIREADSPRDIVMGKQKVAAMPEDCDFDKAAVYVIDIDSALASHADSAFLKIDYAADCARVYADGKLVQDNFWNGKPMLVRVSDLVGKHVELRILPLRKDAPIYLQKEQKAILEASENALLTLTKVSVIKRTTTPFPG